MLPLSVRPYIRTSEQWCLLSKLNSFDQNFMKLGHIVKFHDFFFKFDNGPYRAMPSVVMALCLWKFTIWNYVRSLSRLYFTRILWNLVTLLSTMMSSSSSKWSISHHAFSSYGPLFMKIHHLKLCPLSKSNTFYQNLMKLGHIVWYHDVLLLTLVTCCLCIGHTRGTNF